MNILSCQTATITDSNCITLSEVCYWIFFFLMYLGKLFGLYDGITLYKIILVVGALFFLLCILLTDYQSNELVFVTLFLLLGAAVWKSTGDKGLLLSFAMMTGVKNVRTDRLLHRAAILGYFVFVMNATLSVAGFRYDFISDVERPLVQTIYRHSLGYPNENLPMLTYCVLTMLIVYSIDSKEKKETLYLYAALSIGAIYFYYYSLSRTGLFVFIIFLLTDFYQRYYADYKLIERIILLALYPLCAGGSLLVSACYSEQNSKILDLPQSVSHRLSLAHFYMNYYPIKLFGNRIDFTLMGNYGIDISYPYLLINLGLAAFILISILYIMLMKYLIKHECRTEIAIIVGYLLMGLMEPLLFNTSFKNLSFIFMGKMMFNEIHKYKSQTSIWTRLLKKLHITDHNIRMPSSIEALPRISIGKRCSIIKSIIITFTSIWAVLTMIFLWALNNRNYAAEQADLMKDEAIRQAGCIALFCSSIILVIQYCYSCRGTKKMTKE